MADYPGAVKNFLQLEDGIDTVLAQHMNERGNEITAIETELGEDVAGSLSDLVTRLAVALENDGTFKVSQLTTQLYPRIKTGTYTGNGAATQAITGIGFQPKYIHIFSHNVNSGKARGWKTDQDGTKAFFDSAGGTINYLDDYIISLDADGFTVGDSGNYFNINTEVYTYIVLG